MPHPESKEIGLPKPDAVETSKQETENETADQISFPVPEWEKIEHEYNEMVDEIDGLKSILKKVYHKWIGYRDSKQHNYRLQQKMFEKVDDEFGAIAPLVEQLQHEKLMEIKNQKKEANHD